MKSTTNRKMKFPESLQRPVASQNTQKTTFMKHRKIENNQLLNVGSGCRCGTCEAKSISSRTINISSGKFNEYHPGCANTHP